MSYSLDFEIHVTLEANLVQSLLFLSDKIVEIESWDKTSLNNFCRRYRVSCLMGDVSRLRK